MGGVFMITNIGIYKISNIINGKFYIGSSKELGRRKAVHLHQLRANKHVNTKLQHSFNKYGEENFKFEVLQYLERPDNLLEIEQNWIDKTEACHKGYNIRKITSGGSKKGQGNPRSAIVLQIDKYTLKVINKFDSINEIHRLKGYDVGHINRICNLIKNKNQWKIGYGFYWCYKNYYKNINVKKDFKNPYHKSIVQINSETLKPIKIWGTIRKAEEALNLSIGNISPVCKLIERSNIWKKAYGFYWCYEKDLSKLKSKIDYEPKFVVRPIVKLDKKGHFLKQYRSLKKASLENNINLDCISHALNGRSKTSGGYRWLYLKDYKKMKVSC